MGVLILLVIAVLGLVLVVKMADRRGRGGFLWGFLALLCWPLAALLLLAVGPTEEEKVRRVERDERARMRARGEVS
jgi:hypothetical protein